MKGNKKATSWHFLALILSQIMVAVNIVGSKHLLTHISSLFILCARFIIASLFLLLIYLALHRKSRYKTKASLKDLNAKTWFIIIAQALCAGVFFNFLFLTGLHYTDANVAGIITSVLPAIIALLSVIFLREHMTLLMCQHFLGHTIKQLFELPRILQVINNH